MLQRQGTAALQDASRPIQSAPRTGEVPPCGQARDWDRNGQEFSPEGTAEPVHVCRPFGTYPAPYPYPALKRWAILGRPSGTWGRQTPLSPSGIGLESLRYVAAAQLDPIDALRHE